MILKRQRERGRERQRGQLDIRLPDTSHRMGTGQEGVVENQLSFGGILSLYSTGLLQETLTW